MGYYTPPTYTPEQLEVKLKEFKELYSQEGQRPTKSKLSVFLDVADCTRSYWKQEGNPLRDQIIRMETWIKTRLEDLAFDNVKHAEFQLSRAYNMSETQKKEISGNKDKPLNININWKVQDGV